MKKVRFRRLVEITLYPKWDRIGGNRGVNFTTLPDNDVPSTYDQRAIPYLENPEARHVGSFDNGSYFEAIDAIKSGDLEGLNRVIIGNRKEPITEVDFDLIKRDYDDFQDILQNVIGRTDTTYGLKGTAAPWRNRCCRGEINGWWC